MSAWLAGSVNAFDMGSPAASEEYKQAWAEVQKYREKHKAGMDALIKHLHENEAGVRAALEAALRHARPVAVKYFKPHLDGGKLTADKLSDEDAGDLVTQSTTNDRCESIFGTFKQVQCHEFRIGYVTEYTGV